MSMTPIARAVAFAALGSSITVPTLAHAEFIKDSKASIELRNFYFNRDFRQEGASQSRPRNGPRASSCATNPATPRAPSVSASTPSACSG